MELIPVLDLQRGQAVHARRGERSAYAPVASVLLGEKVGDALALGRAYRSLPSVRHCYVADLDAIRGGPRQNALLRALAAPEGFGAGVWLDAAITCGEDVTELDVGVSGIVVGHETLADMRELPRVVAAAAGVEVIFSLDLMNGRPVRRDGGQSDTPVEALAADAAAAGVHGVLVLDLARVGSDAGPHHLDLVAALGQSIGCPVYHGGGVRGPADLAALEAAGCEGVLVGTALHAGRLGVP